MNHMHYISKGQQEKDHLKVIKQIAIVLGIVKARSTRQLLPQRAENCMEKVVEWQGRYQVGPTWCDCCVNPMMVIGICDAISEADRLMDGQIQIQIIFLSRKREGSKLQ